MNHTVYTMTQPPVPRSHIIQWHNLIRAVWIGGLAVYIIHLNSSDSLHYYLAPTMQKLLLCCPVPLLFIAAIMAWHGLFGRNEVHCDCEHPPPSGFLRSALVYGLIALPLLLGFLLPDRALGSSMASQKGMSLTYAPPEIRRKEPLPTLASELNVHDLVQQTPVPPSSVTKVQFVPPDEYSREFAELAEKLYAEPVIDVYPEIFSETLGTIDMFQRQFAGKDISLTGFVYRDKSMEHESHFALGRFLVMCCPADAAPFGVMIHIPDADNFPTDSWVQIDGTIGSAQVDGKDTIEIRATKVMLVEQPATPYIYTSADSVMAYENIKFLQRK
ncbi:TIGR03943 family protein [Paenibacillus sp. PCH8]|uniref:TIGR03943 family putative permease subunit n=1 Tax=Paenibacillus sp. PCH8 TaxID=2066524 RepID=UPI000CF92936|nr:TIGR03943 family protein [Paenibacillus sp. PCH8]PQP81692.1 TIGR03943 family protein [Paenibacillus sp. PCH8]